MKIKKAKNLKEINICLYAFFGVLLILAIRSAFSGEKWDCAVLGLLMLILFLLFMLINLEWEVNCAGITCYILFGKIKVKTYLWSNFCYVGSLLVLGKGRTLTSEMIVCAENKPYKKFSNSITDSNLNHTGIYLYSKGKIMIHLTFDYKTDEKCTTPGQYLKYHRTFQGLSTRELAEKVGIVPATLVLYENDRHPIKYSTAVALANVLGIDRNRLLDEYTAFVDYPYFSLLKKVRQDLSLTQIQMAELIGIGQTSYSGWEREIRVPRRKEYDKILAALKKLRVNVDTYLCQSASI